MGGSERSPRSISLRLNSLECSSASMSRSQVDRRNWRGRGDRMAKLVTCDRRGDRARTRPESGIGLNDGGQGYGRKQTNL
jgi:hypothetical protein